MSINNAKSRVNVKAIKSTAMVCLNPKAVDMLNKFLAITLLCAALAGAATTDCASSFARGVQAYEAAQYENAVVAWELCLEEGIRDEVVYRNLGDAWFRSGSLGRALQHWKTAALINPTDPDLQHNIEFARARTVDRQPTGSEENPVLLAMWKLHHALGVGQQLMVLLAISWIVGFLLALWAWFGDRLRNLVFVGLLLLSVPILTLSASAGLKAWNFHYNRTGVVVARSAEVLSGPGNRSQVLHVLNEGTQVEVREAGDVWVRIAIGTEIAGFLRAEDVGVVGW